MKFLRRLYYRIFPHYKYHERICVSWNKADSLIACSHHSQTESERWVLDTEFEDANMIIDQVYICRRERITE